MAYTSEYVASGAGFGSGLRARLSQGLRAIQLARMERVLQGMDNATLARIGVKRDDIQTYAQSLI